MKNRTIGSIFIVAGTTIGAGMLAMPLVTTGIGFGLALLLLVTLWGIMCYTSLLMIEVYQYSPPNTGLSTLAYQYLGNTGRWITSVSMLFLMYALTAAYISGAGELLTTTLNGWFNFELKNIWGVLLFTFIGGVIIYIGTHSVDLVNRLLFTTKLVVLVLILLLMLPHIKIENLSTLSFKQGLILSAIPVIFTSFGFHGSIPSIVNYMQGDSKKLRWIFICGSALPLLIYILWQMATLGSINANSFVGILASNSGLSGFLTAVKTAITNPYISLVLRIFADVALATSFLGVTLGLFDFLADLFKHVNTTQGRLKTSLYTFLPPIVFAIFYPQGFILALGFAAIPLAILAIIVPILMILKLRKQHVQSIKHYRVKGNHLILKLILFSGLAIIAIQLCIAFNILAVLS